jgi:hypothetical protein
MRYRIFASTDRRSVLSMLWVFVVFNYLYADIVILIFSPGAYQSMAGRMTASVALVATLLMELLLAMAFLSRVLEYPVNRWCNIVAGIVGTAFVAVTLGPKAPIVYWMLSIVEIACTLFIVWYAWTWREVSYESIRREV